MKSRVDTEGDSISPFSFKKHKEISNDVPTETLKNNRISFKK